jgi:hypothetical protein
MFPNPQRLITCSRPLLQHLTSPQAPGEPCCARVDAALPPDEPLQGLRIWLVHGGVPHNARPLAPSTLVGFCWGRSAPNDRSERVFPPRYLQPDQAQRPASPVNFATFRRPPRNEVVDGGQVPIDRIAVPGGLAVFPGVADPFQVLVQGCRGVRDGFFWRRSWLKCR